MGRKRKSGEGTIRLRKDGRWEGRVVVGYDDKGLPKTKKCAGKDQGGLRGETGIAERIRGSCNLCQGQGRYALRRVDDILV